jgi:hypothetical protein
MTHSKPIGVSVSIYNIFPSYEGLYVSRGISNPTSKLTIAMGDRSGG